MRNAYIGNLDVISSNANKKLRSYFPYAYHVPTCILCLGLSLHGTNRNLKQKVSEIWQTFENQLLGEE